MTDKAIIDALNMAQNTDFLKINFTNYDFGVTTSISINDIIALINRQQAEIDDARIGVKSYKGKYESAVKTARELQTLVDEQQAEIENLQKELASKGLKYSLLEREKAEDISGFVDDLKLARAEAIKEFEDEVEYEILHKEYWKEHKDTSLIWLNGYEQCMRDVRVMLKDKVKEMVGEDK